MIYMNKDQRPAPNARETTARMIEDLRRELEQMDARGNAHGPEGQKAKIEHIANRYWQTRADCVGAKK